MSPIAFIPPDLRRLEKLPSTLLLLFRFAGRRPLVGIASLVDWRLYGHLSRRIIDGFTDGRAGEPLLVPLGRRLSPPQLLVLGLGDRGDFGRERFSESLDQGFGAARGLGHRELAIALPGRPEGAVKAADAIEWFLSRYEAAGSGLGVHLVEPVDAQKAMAPSVERWRLRQLVPASPPS